MIHLDEFSIVEMSASNALRSVISEAQLDFGMQLFSSASGDNDSSSGDLSQEIITAAGGFIAAKIGGIIWKSAMKMQRAKRLALLKKVRKALQHGDKRKKLEAKVARRFYKELVNFNEDIFNRNGTKFTEIDVELKNVIIEVASGGGKGKTKQMINQLLVAQKKGKAYIVFAPNLGLHLRKKAQELGIKVYNTLDELEDGVRSIGL